GIAASFSRPRVSDDNAMCEAIFRTLKYRPGFPRKPFASRWTGDTRNWSPVGHVTLNPATNRSPRSQFHTTTSLTLAGFETGRPCWERQPTRSERWDERLCTPPAFRHSSGCQSELRAQALGPAFDLVDAFVLSGLRQHC